MTDNIIQLFEPDDGEPDEFAEAVFGEIVEMVPQLEELTGDGQYWRLVQAREADDIEDLVEVRDDLVTDISDAHRRHMRALEVVWAVIIAVGIGALVVLYFLGSAAVKMIV